MVLEEGLTVGGLSELFEVINHAEVIEFIEEQIGQGAKMNHSLIDKNIPRCLFVITANNNKEKVNIVS